MKDEENKYLYSSHVLDLIRVGTEYCRFLENRENPMSRDEFTDLMRGLLPMLYLKMAFVRDLPDSEGWTEPFVTEEDYNLVRTYVSHLMAERDDYLDVFVEDFKYSDTPVLRTISEDLADIYQAIRELVEAFRMGNEEMMEAALKEAKEGYESHWGQTLLNALRALHDARFGGVTISDI